MFTEKLIYPWLIFSIICSCTANTTKSAVSKAHLRNSTDVNFFTMIAQLVATLVLLALTDDFQISWLTAGMAILFGVITLLANLSAVQALHSGPMSLTTTLAYIGAMMIPALSGALFFNEDLPLSKILGVGCMLITIPLMVYQKKRRRENGISVRWIIFAVASMILSGLTGVMQKIHQSSSVKSELNSFILLAFAFATAGALIMFLIQKRKQPLTVDLSPKRAPFWLTIVYGVTVAFPNKINLWLSGVMESAVFFPLVNGGGIILALLAAVVLFRERPSKQQWIGLAFGVLAVFLLCGLF